MSAPGGGRGEKDGCTADGIAEALGRLEEELRRRAEAESALRRTVEELEDKVREHTADLKAVGDLVGGVAHDLNNILAGVVGYPELLLDEVEPGTSLHSTLGIIQTSGLRAAAVIQDLLTLTRRGVMVRNPSDLNHIAQSVLSSNECRNLRARHPEVALTAFLEENLPWVHGSAVHLCRAVGSLVANAFDSALPRGGRVRVSTLSRRVTKPFIGWREVAAGHYAVLSVEDGGPGMREDDLPRLFEPFYTRKVLGRSGTGLGLPVVLRIVQDHDGHLDVRSGPDGTVFDLYFPVVQGVSAAAKPEGTENVPRGRGERVFVVDDDANQRLLACEMLRKLGYRPTSAASGEEAVTRLAGEETDLVLLDMVMPPGMGGLETYREIARLRPGQRAVIASGFAEPEDVAKAQALGAGLFLRKPYSLSQLAAAVRGELDRPER